MKQLALSQSQLRPIKKNKSLPDTTDPVRTETFSTFQTYFYYLLSSESSAPEKKRVPFATHSSVNKWSSGTEIAIFLANFSFLSFIFKSILTCLF